MIPTYRADNLSSPSIAFPLRLQQGLLQKTDERETYLMLVGIMARTPRGSWAGHPLFGFQEFFPEIAREGLSEESRERMAAATAEQINSVLLELGLTRYRVDSLVLDPLQKSMQQSDDARWTTRATEGRGVTLLLREHSSDRTVGYAL
ncbi:hypothetical protein [Edaphobacter modestus]|uniref:Uncharacterized protein n=1 Tax=Edaphobacter modestus TaxID=388466 RepID=A0A4Q7YS01_9BACT|nr:hypothetical protein [Edaphobacter modestus]RZU40310.1 hypothetical protein BDD14_1756 [Edaphobacter modestus]